MDTFFERLLGEKLVDDTRNYFARNIHTCSTYSSEPDSLVLKEGVDARIIEACWHCDRQFISQLETVFMAVLQRGSAGSALPTVNSTPPRKVAAAMEEHRTRVTSPAETQRRFPPSEDHELPIEINRVGTSSKHDEFC